MTDLDFETVRDLFNHYTPGSDGRTQQDRTEFFAVLARIQARLEAAEAAMRESKTKPETASE